MKSVWKGREEPSTLDPPDEFRQAVRDAEQQRAASMGTDDADARTLLSHLSREETTIRKPIERHPR
jgi:hypothetical protein